LAVRGITQQELLQFPRTQSGALPYHQEIVRALVWEAKYHTNPYALSLCVPILKEQLYAIAGDIIGTMLLIPIPMSSARRRERGHNHTEILCEALLHSLGSDASMVEYAPRALVRTTHTKPQQGLSKNIRTHNVKGSMQATSEVLGRVCVVVDDVETTGATLEEARRALRAAGAQDAFTITVAQTV